MKTQHPGTRILRLELLAHDARPHAAGSAKLGDFFQKIIVRIEEERKPGGKFVDVEPGVDSRLHICDAIAQRERHFLDGA